MTVLLVVQARMGSTRLPGKVAADLGGVPVLRFLLDRLATAPVEDVVVATTAADRDDAVVDIARAAGRPVVRGSEDDVLARFVAALDAFPADHVVRITADCPLVDPDIVGAAIARHLAEGADYTSNTIVRTFPDGLDVEVVRAGALRDAAHEAVDRAEREHVTPFVYRRPDRYALAAFRHVEPLGDERWTIDTPEDLAFLREAVAQMDGGQSGWLDVLDRVGRRAPAPPAGTPLLTPAQDATPATRVWDVTVDGAARGRATVAVAAGRGELTLDVDPRLEDAVREAVRDRLRGDMQVVELVG